MRKRLTTVILIVFFIKSFCKLMSCNNEKFNHKINEQFRHTRLKLHFKYKCPPIIIISCTRSMFSCHVHVLFRIPEVITCKYMYIISSLSFLFSFWKVCGGNGEGLLSSWSTRAWNCTIFLKYITLWPSYIQKRNQWIKKPQKMNPALIDYFL